MTGIILLRNKYAYRYLDQFGKLRTMNLGVQSYELAVKIASKFLGEPLNPERRAITLEIGQYLQAALASSQTTGSATIRASCSTGRMRCTRSRV